MKERPDPEILEIPFDALESQKVPQKLRQQTLEKMHSFLMQITKGDYNTAVKMALKHERDAFDGCQSRVRDMLILPFSFF